jgi:hypothetical protein
MTSSKPGLTVFPVSATRSGWAMTLTLMPFFR